MNETSFLKKQKNKNKTWQLFYCNPSWNFIGHKLQLIQTKTQKTKKSITDTTYNNRNIFLVLTMEIFKN